jgi:hypothetical protein
MATVGEKIQTVCGKCGKTSEVRGLDWSDLNVAVADRKIVTRICANCSFRESKKGTPMSAKEKAYRQQYNKDRNAKIKLALELLKAQEEAAAEA